MIITKWLLSVSITAILFINQIVIILEKENKDYFENYKRKVINKKG